MRSGAGTDYSVLGTYDTGTEVSVIGVSGAWYKVSIGGTEGYIRSDFVSLSSSSAASTTTGGTSTSTTATASSTVGQKIVDTGMKYLGTPYVWAGTSPSGFDCSGFVYYVYKECGYSTSRTAASLFTNGDYVERDNLQAGDIICFTSGSGSYIGHCGIYIGDGKFVHASSGNGSVIVSSLSETYYNTHYYGARRVAY
jgi:N-acetylmuramoyl-L-alanine amidase